MASVPDGFSVTGVFITFRMAFAVCLNIMFWHITDRIRIEIANRKSPSMHLPFPRYRHIFTVTMLAVVRGAVRRL
jgi:hypothetical protein